MESLAEVHLRAKEEEKVLQWKEKKPKKHITCFAMSKLWEQSCGRR